MVYDVLTANFQSTLKPLIRVAWTESPSLAIQLVSRFNMPSVHQEVRWLLLNFPAKAIYDAEALPILFGGELPEDVRFQLKVGTITSVHNFRTDIFSIFYIGHL
jgi:phosphatidylinositol 4-kinase